MEFLLDSVNSQATAIYASSAIDYVQVSHHDFFIWVFRIKCIIQKTWIIQGRRQALSEAYTQSLTARHSFYCVTGEELAKSYKPFIPLLRQTVSQGGSSTIITSIMDKSTIMAVEELAAAGAKIRHKRMSELRRCVIYDDRIAYFSIIEPTITREAVDSVDQTEGDDLWIASTEASVIQSAKKRFVADWNNATTALDRINELEKGESIDITRVIKENEEAVGVYKAMAANVKSEALYLLPTSQALVRVNKAGIIELLVKAAKDVGAKVRILCPIDSENVNIVKYLEKVSPHLEVREHEPTTSTVLMINRRELFTSELRNNNTYDLYEALSFSVYSNSKPTIESHISLFESLWKQKELYNQLQKSTAMLELANEQLKTHDKMQQEFINIAAHELRTPIQPILGMVDLLEARLQKDTEEPQRNSIVLSKREMDMIVRNAKRLGKLSSDILEITRIESNLLKINKEQIDLKEIIISAIQDAKNQIAGSSEPAAMVANKSAKNIEFDFNYKEDDIFVSADKEKIAQVVYNLLDNATKFMKDTGGMISITLRRQKENDDKASVIVSVKDKGHGIDTEILPRLFTKFATKSERGTGLGLYISKSIIEAHGGRIWAENNKDGKGATFAFSIPISE